MLAGACSSLREYASNSSYMPSFRSGIAQRPNSRTDEPKSPRERARRMPMHSNEWRAAPLTEEETHAKFKDSVDQFMSATNPGAASAVRPFPSLLLSVKHTNRARCATRLPHPRLAACAKQLFRVSVRGCRTAMRGQHRSGQHGCREWWRDCQMRARSPGFPMPVSRSIASTQITAWLAQQNGRSRTAAR